MYATLLREFAVLLFFILKYNDALPPKTCKIPNADAGLCINLDKCDPLYKLNMKNPKTPEEDTFFRQSVGSCNSRGTKIKVCCPPKSQWEKLVIRPVIYPQTTNSLVHDLMEADDDGVDDRISQAEDSAPPTLTMSIPKIPTMVAPNDLGGPQLYESITETCGIDSSSGTRIIGGNSTDIYEYPWLALLEYKPKQFRCGGSLISRSHILTAAHCLYTTPSQVRLSEYNLVTEPTDEVEVSGGGKDYITVTIMKIGLALQHPEHIPKTSINDLGLIKMTNEVKYGDFIKPICLPQMDYRNVLFNVSTSFTVAGWGSDNKFVNSEVKRAVRLPYIPMDVCTETINDIKEEQVVCAGGEDGKDTCRGDSGGPLMYEDGGTYFVLVGIVSSGFEQCGTKDRPGVYTYVYNYVDWIKKTMSDIDNK